MINFETYKENAEERLSYTSSDTPRTFIRALEDIVKLCEYGQKLEIENRILQERIQKLERQRVYLACELSSDDDQTDCNHTHLSCEHRKGWLCKAGLEGQVQCWISEAEKFAKEGK